MNLSNSNWMHVLAAVKSHCPVVHLTWESTLSVFLDLFFQLEQSVQRNNTTNLIKSKGVFKAIILWANVTPF